MANSTQLKKVRQFRTDSAPLLSTQLSRFEGNVQDMLAQQQANMLGGFSVSKRYTAANPSPIGAGTLSEFDTSAGGITCTLEKPSRALAGKLTAIVLRATAAPLTIKVSPPVPGGTQGQINGSSSISRSSAGLILALCDGSDWWTT